MAQKSAMVFMGWGENLTIECMHCPIILITSFLMCLFVLYRKPKKSAILAKDALKKPFAQDCPGANMSESEEQESRKNST